MKALNSGAHGASLAARMTLCLAAAGAIVAGYRAEAPEGCDPQNAGGLTIADIPSKRPSLANTILCAANPESMPLLTRAKKGQKLTQMEHTYYVEIIGTRKTGGATDGQDVSQYEGGRPRKAIVIRAQEFRRTFKVGQQSQYLVDDVAVPDQFAKLKIDYGLEILKDIEARLLSDLPSAADEGTEDRGSRFGGLGYFLAPVGTAMADNPIPDEVRIPANQVYTGTIANFNEDQLQLMMQNKRTATGHSDEMLLIVGTALQAQIDTFERYELDRSGYTSILRTMNNVGLKRELRRGIRFYEGTFGSAEVVMDDFLPDALRAYLLDMDDFWILPFEGMAKFSPLPDMGGGPRGLLKMTLAAKPGDVRGHLLVKASG